MKDWQAQWIGIPGVCMIDSRWQTLPAPEFRQRFVPERTVARPEVFLCGLGYFEWSVNGRKVTPDRLVPAPTEYDKRWRYLHYVLDFPLEAGQPYLFSVILGNGLYNCQTPGDWHFDKANWRDYPKMIFQLESEGKVLLASGPEWVTAFTGTRYDSLRGGEIHDARLEKPFSMELPPASAVVRNELWNADRMPDEGWHYAWVVPPPGGIGEEQDFPGCREVERHPMTEIAPRVWKAPVNGAGVPVLQVQGEAGAQVRMTCGERLTEDGLHLDNRAIASCPESGHFQEDTYVLKGGEPECWQPRFTYHGFQYVEVRVEGKAQVLSLQQLLLSTGFARHGTIRTPDARLTRLEEAARRANRSNFCGYPTDCPTREKNGWTSESMLMCEAMLYVFDAARAFGGYLNAMLDAQRPSGQLPGIVPSAGWGYNWGGGGHWDLALFEIARLLWLFTGDEGYLRRAYGGMQKNLAFFAATAENGISHGLGDWLPPEVLDDPLGACATACRIEAIRCTILAARVLGETADLPDLERTLREVKETYNRAFYCGNGIYRGKSSTFSALPLNFHIVPPEDRAACAAHLAETLREREWKVDYGTIGSRQVPRALFENGCGDDAFRLLTQRECPGYQYMVERSSTLTETWDMQWFSLNHGAFSDAAACLYRYLAGFRHSESRPGRSFLEIAPLVPAGLEAFAAEYAGYRSGWQREKDAIRFRFVIPAGASAVVRLPDGSVTECGAGEHSFSMGKG